MDMASVSLPPATTQAQLNYQYDLIDDTPAKSDYSYNDNDDSSSMVNGNSGESSMISAALISSPLSSNRSSMSLVEDDSLVRDPIGAGVGSAPDFNTIMESRTNESNEFRVMIVCLGLVIISIGILANLVFSLLVVCKQQQQRRRRRQHTSSSLLIMTSMSLVYLVFLILYCFKISVYFSGDNIIKFHIYDTIENWSYGQLMCRVISSAPICCKLISRLCLLILVLKRLVSYMLPCSSSSGSDDEHDGNDHELHRNGGGGDDADDTDVNIIKRTSSTAATATRRGAHKLTHSLFTRRVLIEWPLVTLLVALACVTALVASWPLFTSYQLTSGDGSASSTDSDDLDTNAVCDSFFRFPDDIRQVQALWFNYLVYGLIVPMGVALLFLIALQLLQTDFCASLLNINYSKNNSNGSSFSSSTFSSSSQQSTPNRKLTASSATTAIITHPHLKSSSTASFDEINTSNSTANKDDHSTSSSSAASSSTSSMGALTVPRSNNLMLWITWFIIVATSLPQEIYRYTQLKIDFNNDEVLTHYLESILVQPIVRARPYYAAQLIYAAEFALVPLVFILFYSCTLRQQSRRRHQENKDTTTATAVATSSPRHLPACLFYDADLVRSTTCQRGGGSGRRRNHSNTRIRGRSNGASSGSHHHRHSGSIAAKSILFDDVVSPAATNRYPLLANHKQYAAAANGSSEPKLIYSKKLRPTPFELAANAAVVASTNAEHYQPPNYYQGGTNSSTSSSTTNTTTQIGSTCGGGINTSPSQLPSNGGGGNVLHIIQHPSWRINIKQQPHHHHFNNNNSNGTPQPMFKN